MSDIMKKTRFLNSIKDTDYKPSKVICRADEKNDFETTIIKIPTEAKAMGKLKSKRSSQRSYNTSKGKKHRNEQQSKRLNYKAQGNCEKGENQANKYNLPKALWDKMTPLQCNATQRLVEFKNATAVRLLLSASVNTSGTSLHR